MIRPIMKDPIFLAQKSAPATVTDLPIAQDLRDTLEAHRDGCVGMAANMIGAAKRIIIFDDNGSATVKQPQIRVVCIRRERLVLVGSAEHVPCVVQKPGRRYKRDR